ncbi:MAG: C13 family peptidase, partial [Pseudomonadales bacterium]|nr:C13 family peptidase [Pseudomonadales bacterium]
YVSADGDQYHGGFSNGRFDGKGSYTLAEPVEGIKQYTGRWQNGELIDASEESLVYNQKLANEALIYNQSALLETALNQIKANNPAVQELYFIGIGGDGRQEVFRREVEYVESLFKQNLTTEGHSVALINSKRTYNRTPMATNTSVKQMLDKFAANMDRENDILFLYLTSHGSREHDFFLNQPGLPLPDLSAVELARHLQSLSIQHKVVVISACYSGGFIPFLDDGKTLVITAAREDRTSFGCDDRNDFTFFGEAYFKEGIAKGLNFTEAFEIAKQQIEQWETEEGLEASHPQIKAPDQLAMRLNKWFAEKTSPVRLVEAR